MHKLGHCLFIACFILCTRAIILLGHYTCAPYSHDMRTYVCTCPSRLAGPSDGGGERGIFKQKGQGQARWAFRAWGSGGDGIYRMHTWRAVRDSERTAYLSTWQRLKQASCLTNSCTSHMLTVSNHIPLHVHAVFCHNNYFVFPFGARHDAHIPRYFHLYTTCALIAVVQFLINPQRACAEGLQYILYLL